MTTRASRPGVESLAALDALGRERGVVLERDVPLAPLTTLRVGGAAERMTTASSVEELVAALQLARDAGVPAGILGKGSDIVVADAGVAGLVIRNRADRMAIVGSTLRADSGAAMAAAVKRCTAAALTGLEFGISIPGSMGGAVWANAGAHGSEMKDVVVAVDAWSPGTGERVAMTPEQCRFEYRDSAFKGGDTSHCFQLHWCLWLEIKASVSSCC